MFTKYLEKKCYYQLDSTLKYSFFLLKFSLKCQTVETRTVTLTIETIYIWQGVQDWLKEGSKLDKTFLSLGISDRKKYSLYMFTVGDPVVFDFSLTVKSAPHECVIRTCLP